MELDHVVIAVPDLAAAAGSLEERYGLGSVEGGRHPGLGTANRIVPLGDAYVEVVAVVDVNDAAASVFGMRVGATAERGASPMAWVVRTDDVDEPAARLGLTVVEGSRITPDGRVLRWRAAGLDRAMVEPFLPFFIEWAPGTPHPGREPATHEGGPWRLTRLRLQGDPGRLATWLGGQDLPVEVRPGEPAITGVVLAGAGGEVDLDLR